MLATEMLHTAGAAAAARRSLLY